MPTVHILQLDIVWEDPNANQAQVEALLDSSSSARPLQPESLIVLPELFHVGFSMNVDALCEQATGNASEKWCSQLARKREVFVQGASIRQVDGPGAKATNNAVVFNPAGDLVCRYEKVFPFTGAGEHEAYCRGEAIATFQWHGMTVCPLICYDLRFPELWRIAALDHGAEMFTIGASWPAIRHQHWSTLLDARAIENQAYIVAANRCGTDPNLPYLGGSKIVDPQGHVLVVADDARQVIAAEIDPSAPRRWRSTFDIRRDVQRSLLGGI